MSKIGKKNINIPKESSIKVEGPNLTISGPKGTKKLTINDKIFSSKTKEVSDLPIKKNKLFLVILKSISALFKLIKSVFKSISAFNKSKFEDKPYFDFW